MPVDPELLEMYESTVMFHPAGTRRDDGKLTIGDGVELQAHVEEEAKRIVGSDGAIVDTIGSVWLLEDITTPDGSEIVLPSGRRGIVKVVERVRDSEWGTETVLRVGKGGA